MDFDLTMADRLLTTTRAVRKRLDLDRPVSREIILECLDVALQAPNGSNRQEWRWLVIDDAVIKSRLADVYRNAAEAYFAAVGAGVMEEWSTQTKRIFESWKWLVDNLAKVPVLVIPCSEVTLPSDLSLEKMASVFGSIFPAVWSFQLALHSRGLGSTLTTLHLANADKTAQLLNIPEGVVQVAMLPVAYTLGTDFRRAERTPAETITHWNGW